MMGTEVWHFKMAQTNYGYAGCSDVFMILVLMWNQETENSQYVYCFEQGIGSPTTLLGSISLVDTISNHSDVAIMGCARID